MNVVDWVLIGAVVVFAWAGWRQGFVAGALTFAGFLGGGLLAAFLLPDLIEEHVDQGMLRPFVVGGAILVCAVLGQLLMSYVGRSLRAVITWTPARLVDNIAGAGLNVLALAIITWIVATAVAFLPQSTVTSQIRQSGVLVAMDSLIPDSVRNAFSDVRDAVGATAVPRIFSGLGEITGPDVAAPDEGSTGVSTIEAARDSVLRISGSARDCRSSVSGSGFTYAEHYVLTNAHVVAGVLAPTVQRTADGPMLAATVVSFDPKLDVAVLYVPDLDADPLAFATDVAQSGAAAVVAGFPGGGDYAAEPVRIRTTVTARGDDIYGEAGVAREVYSFRGQVQPGNSGGPLLDLNGDVLGMVFGAGLQDAATGYAVTSGQLATPATAGVGRVSRVDSGSCRIRE